MERLEAHICCTGLCDTTPGSSPATGLEGSVFPVVVPWGQDLGAQAARSEGSWYVLS